MRHRSVSHLSHGTPALWCAAMVEYEQRGRIGILTINRPEARNAVNGDVASGMEAGIDRLEDLANNLEGIALKQS